MKKQKHIYTIMIDRAGSKRFPNKNILKIYGKRLCKCPLITLK